MAKVKIYDARIRSAFYKWVAGLATIATLTSIFFEIPDRYKILLLCIFAAFLFLIYIILWWLSDHLKRIKLVIEGTDVIIKEGDIFKQKGLKAISFNEYFDTNVDNKIISDRSLNGIFIKDGILNNKFTQEEIDSHIDDYEFDYEDFVEENEDRKVGRRKRYKLGTICVYENYLLVAFSRFDTQNRAYLTMPDYLKFLINFWDNVNRVYAQQCVFVPIFGSGITRIKEHKNISDEDLLKIMLWTFKISETRFKYPAKLNIIIHESKMDRINLLDIKTIKY